MVQLTEHKILSVISSKKKISLGFFTKLNGDSLDLTETMHFKNV